VALKAHKEISRKEKQGMAMRAELHVVFGATGDSGSAVIRELLRQGKRARAVNRSGRASLPPAVEVVQAAKVRRGFMYVAQLPDQGTQEI
jgi:hypothetical protein